MVRVHCPADMVSRRSSASLSMAAFSASGLSSLSAVGPLKSTHRWCRWRSSKAMASSEADSSLNPPPRSRPTTVLKPCRVRAAPAAPEHDPSPVAQARFCNAGRLRCAAWGRLKAGFSSADKARQQPIAVTTPFRFCGAFAALLILCGRCLCSARHGVLLGRAPLGLSTEGLRKRGAAFSSRTQPAPFHRGFGPESRDFSQDIAVVPRFTL